MSESKRKRAKHTRRSMERDPDQLRAPQTAAHRAGLKVTCRYVGKTFYEGDKINYRGADWECHQGQWIRAEDVNPNHLADPQTESHLAALEVPTCQFLGKTKYEGDLGCWQGVEYVCHSGQMEKTGNSC
jgi:hypothetical protein